MAATLTGVIPLTDARKRRQPTGPNGVAPVGPLPTPDPNAPLQIGDALPYTPRAPQTPAPLEIGDAVPYGGFNTSGPAGRAEGNPNLVPQPPRPVQQPMPGAAGANPAGGFPLAGGAVGGYATTTPYGPGNDLRGTAILPGQSAGTQAASAATQGALGNYTSWSANPWSSVAAPGSYAPAGDTSAMRSALTQAINAVQNAPDRGQLASQNFALLDQTAREASNRDLRVIGQDAAKFGRIGSGITTTNLGDLGERQAIDRSRAQSQMSLDAAGQTVADRLAAANAVGSGFGALSGADLNTAGFNQSLRNESRGERDAANAYNAADFSRRGQLFGDVANYAQQQTGNDAAFRAEARGERAYQGGMETQAYDRNNQAIDRGTAQTNNAFNMGLGLLNAGSGASAPYLNALQGAGQTAAAQGAGSMDAVIAALRQLGYGV
jgi:hypothetical protein